MSAQEFEHNVYVQLNPNKYISLVAITLLYYEYFITVELEWSRFWEYRPEFTWATFFFYLNRYLSLIGHIPIVFEYFWTSNHENKTQICHIVQSYHQYFAVAVQIVAAIMLIMRVYALYERSKKILALMLVITLGALGFGMWAALTGKGGNIRDGKSPYIGCPTGLTRASALRLGAAWAGMLVFDSLVFILTLAKALKFRRMGTVSLLTVLVRDGSMYFFVMAASNLANILTFVLGGQFTRGVLTTWTNVISSIMISRLMFNLRDPRLRNRFRTSMGEEMTTPSTTMSFNTRAPALESATFATSDESFEMRIRERNTRDALGMGRQVLASGPEERMMSISEDWWNDDASRRT